MKINVLIDGFNLYHSIEDLEKYEAIKSKWLDVKSLIHQYLGALGRDVKFGDIFYFTAIREHVRITKSQSISRHKRYIAALESKGVQTIYGGFKPKDVKCKMCEQSFQTYEEKKTDVAIASKIVELAALGECEIIAIVSGDTDLIPAIELAKKMNGDMQIVIFFPYLRTNDELKNYADRNFSIKPKNYINAQFTGLVTTTGGVIAKPSHW